MSLFVASAESAEFRSVAGLEWVERGGDRLEQELVLTDAMCEVDGAAAAGVVAILADSTLGTAAAAARDGSEGIVTLGLHADLMGDLPSRGYTLSMRSERLRVDGDLVWVSGLLSSGGESIGLVTWRGLFVDFGRRHARLREDRGATSMTEPAEGQPDSVPGEGRPVRSVDDALGIKVQDGSPGELRLISRPPAAFASGWGTLHGGAVGLLGHRAARHAADRTAHGDGTIRPLSVDAEFFRPVPARLPRPATGSVVHRGRSYLTAEGRVLLDDGRLAAIIRMTGRVGPS